VFSSPHVYVQRISASATAGGFAVSGQARLR
jgi:hypothetical protein